MRAEGKLRTCAEYFFALFKPFNASEVEVKKIEKFIQNRSANGHHGHTLALPIVEAIEAKSGTLLTHVSMMIAVTGIMFAAEEHPTGLEIVIGVEFCVYLLLALLCIRCQLEISEKYIVSEEKAGDHANKPKMGDSTEYRNYLYGELLYRSLLFRWTLRCLYFLTFVLVFTIITVLFDDDFNRVLRNFVSS